MIDPPSPHPLDFDWRYDDATARTLAGLLRNSGSILALGAPSVARLLDQDGIAVTLVDRQPLQNVRRHMVCAVEEFETSIRFDTAIMDPPWYPGHLLAWSKIAAISVGVGGAVLASVWPEDTRPGAAADLASALGAISDWATIERNVGVLRYAEPLFEIVARSPNGDDPMSRSPLRGELVKLTVNRLPEPDRVGSPQVFWQRFTVDDYQLAVRISEASGPAGVRRLPNADGWRWPFVSARAPEMRKVSIWSSEGEVGIVGDPARTVEVLRSAFASRDEAFFDLALAEMPELLGWRIPRPPYRRSIEWLHRQ